MSNVNGGGDGIKMAVDTCKMAILEGFEFEIEE